MVHRMHSTSGTFQVEQMLWFWNIFNVWQLLKNQQTVVIPLSCQIPATVMRISNKHLASMHMYTNVHVHVDAYLYHFLLVYCMFLDIIQLGCFVFEVLSLISQIQNQIHIF